MKLNIKRYMKNQKVDVIESKNSIFVNLLQDQSTPGIFLEPLFLKKGQYEIFIDANASRQNVFCCHLYDEYKTQRVIKNKKRIFEGRYENVISFNVLKDDVYLPAIIGTECKIGDFINIYDIDLRMVDSTSISNIESHKNETNVFGNKKNENNIQNDIQSNIKNEKSLNQHEHQIYFFDNGSKFGVGTFLTNLHSFVDIEIIRDYEVFETFLKKGCSIFTNGYLKKTQDLAIQYPKQIHCFWHSSFLGVEIMGETSRFIKFLDDIKRGIVNGYFLNQNEILPINGKRFWLPFEINKREMPSKNFDFDFAITLGSPHSMACKNTLSTIMFLLEYNYSFVLPNWYKTHFDVESLKNAIGSISRYEYFQTQKNPIELEYFQKAKFYLASSTTDTMPYSCIESLNSGTPIFMFKGIGWSSVVDFDSSYVFEEFKDLHSFCQKNINDYFFRDFVYQKQIEAFSKVGKSNKNKINTILRDVSKLIVQDICIRFEIIDISNDFLKRFLENSRDYKFCRIINIDLIYDSTNATHIISMDCMFSTIPKDSFFDLTHIKEAFEIVSKPAFDEKQNANAYEIANVISLFFSNLIKDKKFFDLSNVIFLAIDIKNWAFHNISKQIIKHSRINELKSMLIVEYLYLQILMSAFDIKTNVVGFWWKSIELLQSYSFNSKYILMIYDHYSWIDKESKYLLLNICKKNSLVGIGVSNNRLEKDIKGLVVDKPLFVVKDGVDFEMFPLKQKENDEFVFGWIGNSKIQASAGYDKKDLKGLSIIKSAIQSTNQNVLIWDVYEKDILPQSEIFEKFYNHIDCYICMSNCEGTPNTVFESLTCGIPTITTNVGNVEDVLIDGVNGFIIDRNEESLIKAMSDVLRLKNFFRNNRQEIRNSTIDFEWSKRTKQWDLLLNVFQD